MNYTYKAKVTSVYDGDTITVDIDLGFGIVFHKQKLRLYGINTPELRAKDVEVKKLAYEARDLVRGFILDREVEIMTKKDKKGKYGRYLAHVYVNIHESDAEYELVKDYLVQDHIMPNKDRVYNFSINQFLVWMGLAEKVEY